MIALALLAWVVAKAMLPAKPFLRDCSQRRAGDDSLWPPQIKRSPKTTLLRLNEPLGALTLSSSAGAPLGVAGRGASSADQLPLAAAVALALCPPMLILTASCGAA